MEIQHPIRIEPESLLLAKWDSGHPAAFESAALSLNLIPVVINSAEPATELWASALENREV
jgi:hypothetical protein